MLREKLIRYAHEKGNTLPHIRVLTAFLKVANKDLFVLVDTRKGEVVKATDNLHGKKPMFWGRSLPNDWKILHLKSVPASVAWDFLLYKRNGDVSGQKLLSMANKYVYEVFRPEEMRAASYLY